MNHSLVGIEKGIRSPQLLLYWNNSFFKKLHPDLLKMGQKFFKVLLDNSLKSCDSVFAS